MSKTSRIGIIGVAAALAGLGGCVERRITIVSDPPGALVYVNDVEKGRTPVTFPFLWYGDYDVRLRLEQPAEDPAEPAKQYFLQTHRKASAPPYQWLGVDFFAEILPVKFRDHKVWAFNLPPVVQQSDEQLIQDAKQLQGQLDTPVGIDRPGQNADQKK